MDATSKLIAQVVLNETAQLYGVALLGYQPRPAPVTPASPGWGVTDRMREIRQEMAAGVTYLYDDKERRHERDVSDHLDDCAIRDRFLALIRRYAGTTDEALGRGFRQVIDAAILAQAIDYVERAEMEAEEAGDADVPIGEERPPGPLEPGYEYRRRT